MTGSKWALTPPFTGVVARDVVAGILGCDSAQQVARVAVQEAAARGARVRFLHVVPEGASPDERDESDTLSFTAALRALREFPRVPVTFEVAEGEPGPVFVERSTEAGILVVAADDPADELVAAGGPAAQHRSPAGIVAGTGSTAAPEANGRPARVRPAGSTASTTSTTATAAQVAAYCQRHAACDVLTVRSVHGSPAA